MTTIAILNGAAAADTQITGGNHSKRIQKILRMPDGGLVMGCGLWRAAWAGMQYVLSGQRGDPPDIEDAEVIVVDPSGTIWIANEGFPLYPIMDRHYAAGCGADLARSALARGLSPVDAVAEACDLDAMSSPPIMSMEVEPVEFSPPKFHMVKRRKKTRGGARLDRASA
jgi:hypothetical protein